MVTERKKSDRSSAILIGIDERAGMKLVDGSPPNMTTQTVRLMIVHGSLLQPGRLPVVEMYMDSAIRTATRILITRNPRPEEKARTQIIQNEIGAQTTTISISKGCSTVHYGLLHCCSWQKRDAPGSSMKISRMPKKRRHAPSPSRSRSRSPESYYSRRSCSRSRSISPKRRRRDASPARGPSHSPNDRGRTNWRPRPDRKRSKSSLSPRGRGARRSSLSSVSSSSRSRSSSHSPVHRPRAVHRLPPATSIKDVSLPVTHSSRAGGPPDAVSHRNGKGSINGKHSNVCDLLLS
jgi:hypothetical protein